VVVPAAADRLALLAGSRDPDRVVLSGPGPAGSGAAGTVRVVAESTDGSTTEVTAGGAGYLVVGDAIQHGWVATVDGRPVPLVPADHALVAVPVPAGTHTVTLAYQPPGQRLGAGVSGLSVLLLVLAAVLPRRLVSRRARSVTLRRD
jgi:hypothetical protein